MPVAYDFHHAVNHTSTAPYCSIPETGRFSMRTGFSPFAAIQPAFHRSPAVTALAQILHTLRHPNRRNGNLNGGDIMSALLRCLLTTLAVLCIGASTVSAQAQRTLAQRLDSLAGSGVVENRAAGIVAAVVRGNDTLLFKGYGKADVEWDIPMPTDAVFEIGSVTKQFTAVAMLQLRDEGKLSLDDDITKWLPDFDTRGNEVSLRHLLDHTSGIVGLTEIPEFGLLASNSRWPRDSAYALINRQPFQFKTGDAQIYNNSAFWLLGLVIEKASAMSYENYVETKIFEPLGMKRSMYCNSSENTPRARTATGCRTASSVVRPRTCTPGPSRRARSARPRATSSPGSKRCTAASCFRRSRMRS
jgi:CubicO group peptidase (beta-lactamase class C family)